MTTRGPVEPIDHHLLPKELVEELQGGIDRYNGRFHRGIGAAPVAKFAQDPTPLRTLPERLLSRALLPQRARKTVQKAGIQHGSFYHHPRLNRLVGTKVDIAFTDRDPSFVHVFQDDKYICKARITPSRAMAGGLVASRTRQITTFNRIELGAEKLRLEQNGLSAEGYDLPTRRKERANRRPKNTSRTSAAQSSPQPLSDRRSAHLEDETWKAD